MPKILIFGNSGSGKSTLAKKLALQYQCLHLDLDTLAWQATTPPKRTDIAYVVQVLKTFFKDNSSWIIEGCYGDIITVVRDHADKIIFMNLSTQTCVENAENRPWEPHKYKDKATQDENLPMLTDWIRAYETRGDDFSFPSHKEIFESFSGEKEMIEKNV